MKKLLVGLALVLVATFASSADLLLSPGQSAQYSVTATCISCPPPPPPIEVIKEIVKEVPVASPRPGNAHAVYHPDSVKKNGYANCQTCHAPTSTTPAKVGPAGSFICSQYEFCTSGIIGGATSCKIGVTWNDLLSDAPVIDPITKDRIVSGGKVGGYATGSIPQCRDCHYPHATIKEPPKSAIHFGCLDCHKGVGNSDLKAGIKH